MATANYDAKHVAEFASLRKAELEAEMAQAREDYISKPRTRRIGLLWWKVTVARSREECEFLYKNGHWPEVKPFCEWPFEVTLRDRFQPNIRRCDRIIRLCESVETFSLVTLDDCEVSFLRLPKV